jgi:hypothetical protein
MIQISVINESTVLSDADLQVMIPAFQTQWNRDLAPIWDLDQAQFTCTANQQQPPASSWWLVFLDDSDQAGALAYHDVTNVGLPLAKVFVKTIQADHASVSVAATHEICEMAVDPTINLAAQDSNGTFWAYEVCDPVEDAQYGYDINGVLVSDFITPAWFGFKNAAAPLDFQQHVANPFQVLTGGYAQQFGPNGWQQITGAKAEQKAKSAGARSRILHPPVGSRRERRAKPRPKWTVSVCFEDRNEARRMKTKKK